MGDLSGEADTVKVEVANGNTAHAENGKATGHGSSNGKSVVDESDAKSGKKEKKEKMKMVSTMQLFRFADKWDVFLMIIGTICSLLQGAALPCLLLVFGKMTDSFIDAGKSAFAQNKTEEQIKIEFLDVLDNQIKTSSYYYVGIGFGVLVVAYIRVTLWLQSSHRQSQKVRIELFKAVLRQEIGWFDTHDPGELGTRLADDITKLQEGMGDKIANFLQWFATFITGLIIGLAYGWKLSLVIISVSPLLVIAGGSMNYLITSATSKELSAYAKAGAVAEEALSSIRTVVAFCGQAKECIRYGKNLSEAKDFGIRKSMIAGLGMGSTFLIIFLTYALAFWYGGKLVRDEPEHYTAGVMLIVFFSVVIGAFALGNAMPNLENVGSARGAAYVIWNLIDRKSEIDSSSDEGMQPEELIGNIELKDVVFRYPSRPDVPVANGLNVEVLKGQTVALVGASGCGKSTVVQLLLRFYDPLSGSVLLDGNDVKQLNIKWLRRHIGLVGQEPILFASTIGENIRYGRDGITQDDIERAAEEANAHNFIMKLPLKYDTLVGERGAQLSGGQKQRIAIARALVRNPRILLLDEATSALDTESEATVQAALDKARLGRTTIVIAHRLSTIKTADIIYGIKDGVVHEKGTHDQLMELGGIYYELVMNQQAIEAEEHSQAFDEETGETSTPKHMLARSLSAGSNRSLRRKQTIDEVPDGALVVPASKKEEKLKEPSVLRIMALNKSEWAYILFGCIAGIVQGGIQPVFAIIFSSIIGVFANPDLQYQADKIFFYSMMFIVIGGGACLSMFFQAFMFGISGEKLTMRLRTMTFKALLRQEITFFDDHNNSTGALATRLSTDASAMQGATGVRLGMAFQSFASIGTGIIIGFIFSWELTLFIIGFVPLFLISGVLQMKAMKGFSSNDNDYLEQAGKTANEAIVNVRTVASLTKEPKFVSDYEGLTNIPFRKNMRKAHISGITYAFSQSLIFFAYAAIFSFGSWLIQNRGLEFESMFKVFSAVVFGAMAVGQASAFAPDYGKAKIAAARVFALIDQQPAIDSYSTEGIKPTACNGKIEFHDVGFRYPTRHTVPVLSGLSFTVQQGQVIALVGASGCGKSTTVQLLERFYDAESGEVLVDGVNVKQLEITWLRSQIGIVSQEPILFDQSIAENIAYGDNSRQPSMDEIIAAARTANIHSFIETLPEGYNTNVGSKGTQLSGGQKQRIAIARALLRNPKVLLLDEATSALDTESEKVVQEALERAQVGRTSLVIAHRLSTIQNANLIIVIRNGVVAEQGTHSELLALRGLYYRLQLAQARKR